MEAIKPMPAVFDQRYVKRLSGPNVKTGKNKKDLAEQLIADIRAFKAQHGCDRLVMVWSGSTEVFMTEGPVHQTLAAFEDGPRGERRRDSVEHDLRLRGAQGRHAVRQRGAESDRRHPGAAGTGGADRGADVPART